MRISTFSPSVGPAAAPAQAVGSSTPGTPPVATNSEPDVQELLQMQNLLAQVSVQAQLRSTGVKLVADEMKGVIQKC